MESFILDREYKCRRPTLFKYFASLYNYDPYPEQKCSSERFVINPTSLAEAITKIDFNRLYSINYLLAAAGTASESKWGHAMLHLVICAPERRELSIDCQKDVAHHLVVSFAAFVSTIETSVLSGLSGGYPSRVFLKSLFEIMQTYTQSELRDLESYPLILTRSEMKDVIDRIIEMHWSYDNKYFFLSNNCAVETYNLLWPTLLSKVNREELLKTVNKPIELRDYLLKNNLAQGDQFLDRKLAVKNGFLFESYESRYVTAFNQINEILKMDGDNSWKRYYRVSQSQKEYLMSQLSSLGNKQQKSYVANLYLLELHYFLSLRNFYFGQVAQKYLNKAEDSQNQGSTSNVRKVVEEIQAVNYEFAYPAFFLSPGGYGLPNNLEAKDAEQRFMALRKKSEELTQGSQKAIKSGYSEEQSRKLKYSLNILRDLGQRLTKLTTNKGE